MNSEITGVANSLRIGATRPVAAGSAGTSAGAIIGAADPAMAGPNHNMDALLKRLMKFKHLEEDNKKLKNLLK